MNLKDFQNTGKINFSTIDMAPCNQPKIVEKSHQDWIGYGNNNDYPEYLIDLYQNSSINSALVKGVAAQIFGEGLDATDRDEKPEQWLALQMLLDKSQKDFLKNACFDLKLHGYCFINTIWNRTRTKIVECKHIPAQTIRSGKADMSGIVNEYYYSADWSDYRKSQYRPQGIKAFNLEDRIEASQLLMIKDYSPRVFYYSSPDYVGSTNWIQLDVQISDFHLNNISNGLFPSMSIAFNNGIPTDEARQEIERKLQAKFSGNQNSGRLMITFNDGAENAPVISPITSNGADGLYQYLSTECVHKILSGHRITSPLLLGIRDTGGGFGNNADELRDSFDLLQGIVIQPFQETLLQSLKEILSVNAINLDVYFKTLKPAAFLDEEIVEVTSKDEAEKEGVSFKKDVPELDDDTGEILLSKLAEYQEVIDDKEWFQLGEMDIDVQEHEEHFEKFVNDKDNNLYKFYGIPQETPNQKSESDVGLLRVLYRYSQNIATNSRPFCKGMVQASKGGAQYTVNNLQTMGKQSLNPDFAHTGSTYDIWAWKGGVFCHHKWVRVFYLRKQVPKGELIDIGGKIYKGGQYLPPGTLDNFKKVWQSEINKLGFNWSKVRGMEPKYTTEAPINTPLRGAYPGGRFDR